MSNTPRKHTRLVSIKLDADLDYSLTAIARAKNVSRSAVVREALRAYTVAPRTSALELAGDLVGSLKGPGDLSTNKRHMKDLGK
jgi:metal-responsive CopG/Arc/MetJ family transcriptional regulator